MENLLNYLSMCIVIQSFIHFHQFQCIFKLSGPNTIQGHFLTDNIITISENNTSNKHGYENMVHIHVWFLYEQKYLIHSKRVKTEVSIYVIYTKVDYNFAITNKQTKLTAYVYILKANFNKNFYNKHFLTNYNYLYYGYREKCKFMFF